MWRTPATLAGLARRRAQPRPGRGSSDDPRARDQLRRHLRGGHRRATGASRSNVISSQEVHERFGGVVPEIASRHHLELVNADRRAGAARGGRDARGRRAGGRDAGPGARRRAAGRPVDRQGARRRQGAAVRAGRPPAGPRRGELPRSPGPTTDAAQGRRRSAFEPPFVCLIASGGHTLLALVTRARRLRGPRPHARRRRRRGVRQGRADARAGLPRRRGARAAGRGRATPRRSPSPARRGERSRGGRGDAPPGASRESLDFSFAGREDGAALHAARARRGEARGARGRPRGLLPGGDRRAA